MTEHTEGPWAISGDYGLYGSEIVAPNAYTHAIATVWTKRIAEKGTLLEWPEGVANARLISSAPELLAACEEALRFIASPQGVGPHYDDALLARAQIEAAIHKARGQKP